MKNYIILIMLLLCGNLGVAGRSDNLLHNVKVYYYYAKTGAKTADGTRISEEKVRNGEQRIIAISRDLRKKYKFGDKVWVRGYGHFVVRDLMHQRHKNTIDILVVKGKEVKNSKSTVMKKM